jgi:outer membrane lipoprotein-sorting protein
MKKDFSIQSVAKIGKSLQKHKTTWFMLVFFSLLLLMAAGAFFALNPPENKETVKKGEDRIKSLEINFDKQTIQDLKKEQASTTVTGPAGRNPFMPY